MDQSIDSGCLSIDQTDEEWVENLSPKELEFFETNAPKMMEYFQSESLALECTICFNKVDYKQSGCLVRHPLLGIPVCEICVEVWFATMPWNKTPDDGKFENCSWCSISYNATLLCCSNSNCPYAFCTKCKYTLYPFVSNDLSIFEKISNRTISKHF